MITDSLRVVSMKIGDKIKITSDTNKEVAECHGDGEHVIIHIDENKPYQEAPFLDVIQVQSSNGYRGYLYGYEYEVDK